MTPKRILITGAAGTIGRSLSQSFGDRYTMRLLDIADGGNAFDSEFVLADTGDLEQMRKVCEGVDIVVHLAANPRMDSEFGDPLIKSNIVGTYNVFQAASDLGCRRVVYASSVTVMGGYPPDYSVRWDMPLNPQNIYAVTKCFGEALARYFSNRGLSSICVRIGALLDENQNLSEQIAAFPEEWRNGWVSKRDLARLITRCIEIEGVDFAIVHAQSRHTVPRLDMKETCRLLGYQPEDGCY